MSFSMELLGGKSKRQLPIILIISKMANDSMKENMIPKNNSFIIPKLKANDASKRIKPLDNKVEKQTTLSNNIQLSQETEVRNIYQESNSDALVSTFQASSGTKRSSQKLSFSANVPPLANNVLCGNSTDKDAKARHTQYEDNSRVHNKSPKKHRSGAPGHSDIYHPLCLLENEIGNNNEIGNDNEIRKNNDVVNANQNMVTENFSVYKDYYDKQREAPKQRICSSTNLLNTIDDTSSLGIETIGKIRSLSISEPVLSTSYHEEVSRGAEQLSVAYDYNDADCAFEEDLEYGILSYDSNISNDVKYADFETCNLLSPAISENSAEIADNFEENDKFKSNEVEESHLISSNDTGTLGTLMNGSDSNIQVKNLIVCNSENGRKIKSPVKSSRTSIRSKTRPYRYRADLSEEINVSGEVPIESGSKTVPFNAIQETKNSFGPPDIGIKKVHRANLVDKELGLSSSASRTLESKAKMDATPAVTTIDSFSQSLSVSTTPKQLIKPLVKTDKENKHIDMNGFDANNPIHETDRDVEYHSQGLLYFNDEWQSDIPNTLHSKIPQNSTLALLSSFQSNNTESEGVIIDSKQEQDCEKLDINHVTTNDLKNARSENQNGVFLNDSDKGSVSRFENIDAHISNNKAQNCIDDSINNRDISTSATTAVEEGTKKKARKNRDKVEPSSTNRRSSARFKPLLPLLLSTTVEINSDVDLSVGVPCPHIEEENTGIFSLSQEVQRRKQQIQENDRQTVRVEAPHESTFSQNSLIQNSVNSTMQNVSSDNIVEQLELHQMTYKESLGLQAKIVVSPGRENDIAGVKDWCVYEEEEGEDDNHALLHWSGNDEVDSSEKVLSPLFVHCSPSFTNSSNQNKLTYSEVCVPSSQRDMSVDHVNDISNQKDDFNKNDNNFQEIPCEENLQVNLLPVSVQSMKYEQKRECLYKQEEDLKVVSPSYVFPVYEYHPSGELSSSVCEVTASIADMQWARSQESSSLLQMATSPSVLREAYQAIAFQSSCQPSAVGIAFSSTLLSLISKSGDDNSSDGHKIIYDINNDGMLNQYQNTVRSFPSFLPLALASLLPFLEVTPLERYSDESTIPMVVSSNDVNNVKIGKKRVHFCDYDGSSVKTPGRDCLSDVTLNTVRRLNLLIGSTGNLIAGILHYDCTTDLKTPLLDSMLSCCQLLTESSSALIVSKAAHECLSLSVIPGDIIAFSNILTSELSAAKSQRNAGAVIHHRTILRHRIGWMATSVLRAQLRWLLDSPHTSLSVPSASGHPVPRYRRSDIHKMVTLREPLPPVTTGKKKGRKSDVVLMDHTFILPSEMSLSALLTHSLRQIYDAFISAVATSSSTEDISPSLETLVTQFLTATVTESCEQEERPLLEELEITQPQLALSAERGRLFLQKLLTFEAIHELILQEEVLWSTVQESSLIISQQGMVEDRHLCLLAGGWKGLAAFTKQRLISEQAEICCNLYVKSIKLIQSKGRSEEDSILLNNSLIYDFPDIILKSLY